MSSYAVLESGSKQYVVEPQSVIDVELLNVEAGKKEISIENVLFIRQGDKCQVGTPFVSGAKVLCECLGEIRDKKVVAFRFRRRKASRRIRGHRQNYTRLRVKEIIS